MVVTSSSSTLGCGACGFLVQVLRGRWFMIFASLLIMAGAGSTYLFGVYSKEIKATLDYDQSTLNLLGSFKDLGSNVGVPSGMLAEVTPVWFILLVGSAMNFAGYFLIWLAVTKKIPKPAVWQMCAYICIGTNSQTFANTGSLVTCVKNFPESRGMMLGLMKGFVGLSGAIFTQLYYAIYGGDDPESLILLIGWLPAILSLIFVFNIRPMKISRHPNEIKVFYQYLVISVTLALCLMAITIAQKKFTFSHYAYVGSATAVCLFLFLPCLVAFKEEFVTWRQRNDQNAPTRVVVEEPPTLPLPKNPKTQMEKAEEFPWYANICNKPKRGEDYSILQALLSIDMIIVFIATFCGIGCSLAAMNNMGQIGESLGYSTQTVGSFVSLMSIWNFFGRVSVGFLSEILLKKCKFSRTLVLTFSFLLPSIADLLIAFPVRGSVYISSILIGFSSGAQFTLLHIIISELFGLKYYSTLFNCGQLATPLGSYILNVKIVGMLYDREALKQLALKGMTKSMVKELTCIGNLCYKLSFMILAGTNVFGAIVSLILVFRTNEYYRTDIYKKFRDEMESNEREMASVEGAGKQPEGERERGEI